MVIEVTENVVHAFVWAPMMAMAVMSAAGAAYQAHSAKQAADKQMKFQQHMSDTAHQRQMEDMRRAGLNPILSARLGGASTPSGAQPSVIPNIGQAGVQGALSAYNTAAQVAEREAHAELMGVQAGTAKAQEAAFTADAKLKNAQANIHGARLEGELNWETLQKELGVWLNSARAAGPAVLNFTKDVIKGISRRFGGMKNPGKSRKTNPDDVLRIHIPGGKGKSGYYPKE